MSAEHLLTVAIGVGLVVSLLLSELFGLAAGGVVVPGYLALSLDRPVALGVTLGVALVSFLLVRGMSSYLIIYGRRRASLMILTGYILGVAAELVIEPKLAVMTAPAPGLPYAPDLSASAGFRVIGYVIPGLIAIWLDRQGVVQTLAVMLTASAIVRLVLLAVTGEPVGL
jgi:poly-gamma-glutamate biosynthesis protein PgsC/CapC